MCIMGSAIDPRFESYRVDVRSASSTTWEPPTATLLRASALPVTDGVLASWDTRAFSDGLYDLRLSVTDTLELTGTALVQVIVDNQWPFVEQTAPVVVTMGTGGNVYSMAGDCHLYFPPHAFAHDATVVIRTLDASELPDTLAGGAVRVDGGYEVAWGDVSLDKPATLSLSLGAHAKGTRSSVESGRVPAFYVSEAGSPWRRLGGTAGDSGDSLSVSITAPGRFAVYEDAGGAEGEAGISSVSMTPRVFSPTGGFADSQVSIGFSLGRSGPVSVRIYNRAGRLVREVLSEVPLGAGANLVRWDGEDRDGHLVEDGIYLVSIEAQGLRETRTVAIVR
jgi:hypothetical protein